MYMGVHRYNSFPSIFLRHGIGRGLGRCMPECFFDMVMRCKGIEAKQFSHLWLLARHPSLSLDWN